MQLAWLLPAPYALTSDELSFQVHCARLDQSADLASHLLATFASKPRACLRASPLVKTHGWGLHHDAQGRVAAVAVESPKYRLLALRYHKSAA